MTGKELIEKKQERAKVTADIRALMKEHEGAVMPAEKKAEIEKMEASFDALNDLILAEEKQLERERLAGQKEPEGKPKDSEKSKLFARALSGEPAAVLEYRNALSLGTDSQAGDLTAPMDFRDQLIAKLDEVIQIRGIANVVGPIGAAQSLGYPYVSADAADGTWVAENVAAPEESTLAFGRREFKPNRMTKLIKISSTLIQHAPMAESIVLAEMSKKIGAGAESAYMTGDGSAKPLGIFVASDSGIPTGRDVSADNTATAITADGLQNAKYSVKQQYRRAAAWVASRDFIKMAAKLKDTDGQYIWQPSVALDKPDMLLGAPVYESEYAPNTFATGKYVAVYGDFSYYWICDALELTMQILKELYAPNNQIGYLTSYFGDGAPVLGEAFARVKLA